MPDVHSRGGVMVWLADSAVPMCCWIIEITTMKQSLVTHKNRKIKLLRAIYPHVNIQIFYQKDFQDLLGKYGIS